MVIKLSTMIFLSPAVEVLVIMSVSPLPYNPDTPYLVHS